MEMSFFLARRQASKGKKKKKRKKKGEFTRSTLLLCCYQLLSFSTLCCSLLQLVSFSSFFFFNYKSHIGLKPIYRPKLPKSTKTSQYTLVSRAVRIKSVSIPVQVSARKIPAIPASMVRNYLPSF